MTPSWTTLYDLWEKFTRQNLPATTKSILELACGTGELASRLAPDLELTGLDLSEEMFTLADERAF